MTWMVNGEIRVTSVDFKSYTCYSGASHAGMQPQSLYDHNHVVVEWVPNIINVFFFLFMAKCTWYMYMYNLKYVLYICCRCVVFSRYMYMYERGRKPNHNVVL